MGLFNRKPKAPKVEAHVVHTGGRWNITLDSDAQEQAQAMQFVHANVQDFRVEKDISAAATLTALPDGRVAVNVNRRRVGTLPSYWTDGGQTLLRRAAELGAPELRVPCLFAWDRKAGPFEVTVALGHSANVEKVQILPASQVQIR